MPGPHPTALRCRVVQAWEDGEGSFAELAERFKIGEASVNRWVALKRTVGSVEPKKMGGNHRPHVVDEAGGQFLTETLEVAADCTLIELCAAYEEEFDIRVSPQTMSRTVRRLGFTRKRGSSVHELLGEMTL